MIELKMLLAPMRFTGTNSHFNSEFAFVNSRSHSISRNNRSTPAAVSFRRIDAQRTPTKPMTSKPNNTVASSDLLLINRQHPIQTLAVTS